MNGLGQVVCLKVGERMDGVEIPERLLTGISEVA